MDREDTGRYVRLAVPVIVLIAIAGGIWYLVSGSSGVHREAPPLDTLVAFLPPPPPPPPEQKPPPPEEKKVEDIPKPDEPTPNDAPKPMTINGPAQAGTDAFNIGAGDGSGSVGSGTGFGEASYSQYMGGACQQALQQDNQVNRLVFGAEAKVWADQDGQISRVEIVQSSGDQNVDAAVMRDCALKLSQAPPSSMRFPQLIRVRGNRAS